MDPSESSESKTSSKSFSILRKKKSVLLFFACVVLFIILLLGGLLFLATQNTQKKKASIIPPGSQYMAGETIVQYVPGYGPGEEKHEELFKKLIELGITSEEKVFQSKDVPLKYYYKLTFDKKLSVPQIIKKVQELPGIENSSPDYYLQVNKTPNDPLYSRQWNLSNIQADKAWNLSQGSNAVTVAIVDTGVDYNHPDLQGREIIKGPDFSTCSVNIEDPSGKIICTSRKPQDSDPMDENGHGTHVAGIVGAATNNRIGISGITWQTKLLAVKVMGPGGGGSFEEIVQGIEYAIRNGANVINLSLGGPGNCEIFDPLFKIAQEKNIVIIAASGNKGEELVNDTPSLCRGVIVVGATDKENKKAVFSNWGKNVTISAPGVDILSLKAVFCRSSSCAVPERVVEGNYVFMNGTSMAAPHVAGVAALLLGVSDELSPSDIKKCLVDSADSLQADQPIGKLLNAQKALELCGVTPSPTLSPTRAPSVFPVLTQALSAATCLVSLDSIDKKNKAYNLVNLSFSGIGGNIYLQMGQKGTPGTDNGNRYSTFGFFSENNAQGIGATDLSKKKGSNTGELYFSTTVETKPSFWDEPSFSPSPFRVYNWLKQYKKDPSISNSSTNPSDFVTGNQTAWWYLISFCDGTEKSCSRNNIQVKIPKNIGAFFFCSVRDEAKGKDVLKCIGNPICSYNDGPDIGIQPDWACRAWKTSCSLQDFVFFDAGSEGVNVGSFTPEN